jgi:hypothetical protein
MVHIPQFARLMSVVVGVAVLTAGCGGDSPEPTASATESTIAPTAPAATPDPSVTPTVTAAPAPDDEPPSDEAPFLADRADDTAEASDDARLSPVEIRFGVHDGYDRVVLDLEGTGLPGWLGEYDSDPRMAGSGDVVDIAGNAYLVIHVRGVVYPTEEGAVDFTGPTRIETEAGGVIKEVFYGGIFEGQAEVYIGLDSDQPFRVFLLENPTRVVIDVQHP